jgi:hypothetical protein
MSILPQLSSDLIYFCNNQKCMQNLSKEIPYIHDSMENFNEQAAIIFLSLLNHASKPFIRNNFL